MKDLLLFFLFLSSSSSYLELGFARGYITRKKIKEIWRLTDEQFQREEAHRKEKEKEIQETNKILLKSKLKKNLGDDDGNGGDQKEQQSKRSKDEEDVSWISFKTHSVSSSYLEIFLNFHKNSMIPKDINHRNLQVFPSHQLMFLSCSHPMPLYLSTSSCHHMSS